MCALHKTQPPAKEATPTAHGDTRVDVSDLTADLAWMRLTFKFSRHCHAFTVQALRQINVKKC